MDPQMPCHRYDILNDHALYDHRQPMAVNINLVETIIRDTQRKLELFKHVSCNT